MYRNNTVAPDPAPPCRALDTARDASLGIWFARIVLNEALRRLERRQQTVDLDDVAEQLPRDHAGSATIASPLGSEWRKGSRRGG